MTEQIELSRLPDALQEAVRTEEEKLNQYSRSKCEIISVTMVELNPPEGLGAQQKIYRVILLQFNCFEILEQTIYDGVDLGVSKSSLTIGTVKELVESAPAWAGLK